ncbi:putative transporter [Trachipleistophora hominis]|uniref:Putative transporter n=1 Tax=Trachipleistophora hominis TaxID=72359 RepID=L7JYY9_TRAHO|nr:putative transporter [Trachipleistophora hominis]
MYYRFLIPGLLLFALSICEYYNRTSLSYPIGGRISRTVGQMDIFIMFGSLLSILAVPVIVYFLYNFQYYNLGTAPSYLLSYGVLALSFINGYYLSYYYGTYKQNMNKFSYITPLRYALFILLFTPVISEYFCGAKYFCAFPITLMYVIGVFTKSFTRNYKKPVNIFFFVFGIVALIYLGMNMQNLITNVSVNSNVGA